MDHGSAGMNYTRSPCASGTLEPGSSPNHIVGSGQRKAILQAWTWLRVRHVKRREGGGTLAIGYLLDVSNAHGAMHLIWNNRSSV